MNARGRGLRRKWRDEQELLQDDLGEWYEIHDNTAEYLGLPDDLDRDTKYEIARLFLRGIIDSYDDLFEKAAKMKAQQEEQEIAEERIVPENATEVVTLDSIKNNEIMANFHNEFRHGRYYTKQTYNSLKPNAATGKKLNPSTRKVIEPGNVVFYKKKKVEPAKKNRRNQRKTRKNRRSF